MVIPLSVSFCGGFYVHGAICFCAGDGISAVARLSPVRGAIGRGSQDQKLFLPRSVPLPRLCATDVAGEFARHRGMFAAQSAKLYHLGFRCPQISRNTMANANAERDWRIYADFAQHLIRMARELYADGTLPDLEGIDTVYALDLRPSTCACRFFRGLRSDRPRPRSNCIRCSIYAATFRRLSSSATEKCTM